MSSTNPTDAASLIAAMSASGAVPSAAAIRAAMMAAAARAARSGGSAGEQKPDTDGSSAQSKKDQENAEEREEHNHEDLISYEAYRPAKLGYGVKHPDPVVENSSLAAIPPPDITCKCRADALCVGRWLTNGPTDSVYFSVSPYRHLSL